MLIEQTKINGLLGISAKAGKVVFGAEAVQEAAIRKKIKLIIVAKDASDNTKEKFKKIAQINNVKYVILGTIEENSKYIGKQNKAVIGIKDMNIANEILKIIYGGDTIG